MEKNDMSFSIPTWKKQQIRAINLAEEEALYITSPYNLNDFKTGLPSISCIFKCSEEGSDLKEFPIKKEINSEVDTQIAVFVTFLHEVIANDGDVNQEETNEHIISQKQQKRKAVSLRDSLENRRNRLKTSILKQKIYLLNLCQFEKVGDQFRKYYRNEVMKKVLFQYISKCIYNISLIELLLLNNQMLRFSIIALVKTIMLERNEIHSYQERLSFGITVKHFIDYFDEQPMGATEPVTTYKMFAYDQQTMRARYVCLRQASDSKIYFYKAERTVAKSIIDNTQPQRKSVNDPANTPDTPRFSKTTIDIKSQPQQPKPIKASSSQQGILSWLGCLRLKELWSDIC